MWFNRVSSLAFPFQVQLLKLNSVERTLDDLVVRHRHSVCQRENSPDRCLLPAVLIFWRGMQGVVDITDRCCLDRPRRLSQAY
jgi:hypothetical protein